MPYQVESYCDGCRQGDVFMIGNWPEHLGVLVCQTCRKLVNVPVETGCCPGCGHEPAAGELFDHSLSISYLGHEVPYGPEPGPVCPKCGGRPLAFGDAAHLNMALVLGNREKADAFADRDSMEKAIFRNSMQPVIAEFQLDPDDVFDYFHLKQPSGEPVTRRFSFPILMDIRTHLGSSLTMNPGRFRSRLTAEQMIDRIMGLRRAPPEIEMDFGDLDEGPDVTSPDADRSGSIFRGLIDKIRPRGSFNTRDQRLRPPEIVVTCSFPHPGNPPAGAGPVEDGYSLNPMPALHGMARLASPRLFRVVLDDEVVAELEPGLRCRLHTTPGRHRVHVETKLGVSPCVEVHVDQGQRAMLVCQDRPYGDVILRRSDGGAT